MPIRWSSVALFAVVPALAIAAPKPRPKKPPPPVKKPDTAAPAATPTAAPPATTDEAEDRGPAANPVPAPAPLPASTPGGGAGGSSAGGGAGGGSADPAARPDAADKPAGDSDVDSLRQEYLSLRDELFKSRARANAVASQLYSTRIQIKLTYTSGRYYNPSKAVIRLDGAAIYENATGGIAGDDGIRFEGFIAPGRHLITFHVEATGKDDDSFTSTTESQIVVKAVAGKDLLIAAKARDSGDIAYEWKRSERGSYGLGIDVAVRTAKAVETAPTAAPPPAKGAKK